LGTILCINFDVIFYTLYFLSESLFIIYVIVIVKGISDLKV